eukprot:scpid94724/ scgid28261/ 
MLSPFMLLSTGVLPAGPEEGTWVMPGRKGRARRQRRGKRPGSISHGRPDSGEAKSKTVHPVAVTSQPSNGGEFLTVKQSTYRCLSFAVVLLMAVNIGGYFHLTQRHSQELKHQLESQKLNDRAVMDSKIGQLNHNHLQDMSQLRVEGERNATRAEDECKRQLHQQDLILTTATQHHKKEMLVAMEDCRRNLTDLDYSCKLNLTNLDHSCKRNMMLNDIQWKDEQQRIGDIARRQHDDQLSQERTACRRERERAREDYLEKIGANERRCSEARQESLALLNKTHWECEHKLLKAQEKCSKGRKEDEEDREQSQ